VKNIIGHAWRAAWNNDLQRVGLESGVFIGSPGSPSVERLLARLSEQGYWEFNGFLLFSRTTYRSLRPDGLFVTLATS
jgi:hypothetical protein